MRFDIITLFPDMVLAPFRHSLMAKAVDRGLFSIHVHDLRRFGVGAHRVCDDYPYGGGEGMVMKVEPIVQALESLGPPRGRRRILLTSPGGSRFTQEKAHRLLEVDQLVLVCGHYEGIDQRIADHFVDEEISIGDYVLTGGELPAMVIVEAVARLIPEVVGCSASLRNESFEGPLLDHPHYTRPRTFRGLSVPDVLLSGHHARIEAWRREAALRRTEKRLQEMEKGGKSWEGEGDPS